MNISALYAFEVLDSRGNPTIACTCTLNDGSVGTAMVPSGASKGKYEALELRDGDQARYHGFGVLHAISNVNNKIKDAIIGHDAANQDEIDRIMIDLDGTPNKSNLGANALLSVSLAVARAESLSEKKELFAYLTKFNPDFTGSYRMPLPQMNVINGGKHANWATDIQEYMIIPIGAHSMQDAIRMGAEVYQSLKLVLIEKGFNINVGDEGGFAPSVSSNSEPFELLTEAVQLSHYELGKDFVFGLDAAASEFYIDQYYDLKKEHKKCTTDELILYYESLCTRYPVVNLEDIFSQDDWDGFKLSTEKFGHTIQIVGDDLYATNTELLQRGIREKTTNSILIKVNQIGTLSETVRAILLARQHGMTAIVSHRSGETEDSFIADLVVAMGTGQIKTGSMSRSERVAKYNRLLTIQSLIHDQTEWKIPKFGNQVSV